VRNPQTSKDLQVARIFNIVHTVLQKFWGEERAAFITVVSFADGSLKCTTASPSAKQQMTLDMLRIKNEVNRQLGDQIVKFITIHGIGF
jgi:hypothetical protein